MANKKISDLVATAPVVTAALTDQYECNQGGVSKGGTWQKIVDLIGSLNPLTLLGLKVTGATELDGNVTIPTVLTIDIGSQEMDLQAGASIFGPANNWSVSPSGQGTFKAGVFGDINTFALNTDGSASFGGGNATIDAFGAATFSGGAASINGAGEIQSPSYYVGPDQGVTQDVTVLTALPSTFTVLHFSGGILIGTTP